MKNNLISAIAGWKSAALLALVAMVAAVAFSGVLTNNSADAAAGDPKVDQVGSSTVTITVDLSAATTAATAVSVVKDPTDAQGVYVVTGVTSDTDTVVVVNGDDDDPASTATPPAKISAGNWQVHDTAGGDAVQLKLAITVDDGTVAGTEFSVSLDGTTGGTGADVVEVVGVANPGDKVRVTMPASDTNTYRISADSTASAGFSANPGRSFIVCADDATTADAPTTCDLNTASGIVDLEVAIAGDSSKGVVYVVPDGNLGQEVTIKVNPAQVATGLTVAGAAPGPVGISQSSTGDGEAITVKVTNNRGAAVSGQRVRLTTTLGQFTDCEGTTIPLPVCNVTTGDEGTADVTLTGDDRPGSATVTATAGTLTRTLAVTFFGLADSLTASPAGGVATVDQGKSGHIILTVTDKDGNAVKGANPGSSATTEIENPVVVTLDNTEAYEGTPSPLDDVQACSDGTNVAGQCAVQVSAAANASRGIHSVASSLTVVTPTGPKVLSDTIDIRVVGAPDSLTTDAPESVEPRTTVTITVSVYDDDGELVGGGNVKVVKLEGRGAVLGTDDDDNAALSGGQASFRYYATSTDAAAVFELTAGTVTEIIEITVAEAEVEEVEEVVEEVVIPDLAAPTSVTIAVRKGLSK